VVGLGGTVLLRANVIALMINGHLIIELNKEKKICKKCWEEKWKYVR